MIIEFLQPLLELTGLTICPLLLLIIILIMVFKN